MDKPTQALTQLCPELLCDPGQATPLLSMSCHMEAGTEEGRGNDRFRCLLHIVQDLLSNM